MPKQEEIMEGIYKIIIKHDYSPLEQFDWERDLVKQIVEFLHSQRVVILEERIQGYSEQSGQPIKPSPYRILTSLIK